MIVDLPGFVRVLSGTGVDYIIIGGVAGALHGAARSTYDLDIVYSRSQDNVARLVAALTPLHPYLRGAPPNLPFVFDELTVGRGLNFTLTTDLAISISLVKSSEAEGSTHCCPTPIAWISKD